MGYGDERCPACGHTSYSESDEEFHFRIYGRPLPESEEDTFNRLKRLSYMAVVDILQTMPVMEYIEMAKHDASFNRFIESYGWTLPEWNVEFGKHLLATVGHA